MFPNHNKYPDHFFRVMLCQGTINLYALVEEYRCLCYGWNGIIRTKYSQTIDGPTEDRVPENHAIK